MSVPSTVAPIRTSSDPGEDHLRLARWPGRAHPPMAGMHYRGAKAAMSPITRDIWRGISGRLPFRITADCIAWRDRDWSGSLAAVIPTAATRSNRDPGRIGRPAAARQRRRIAPKVVEFPTATDLSDYDRGRDPDRWPDWLRGIIIDRGIPTLPTCRSVILACRHR